MALRLADVVHADGRDRFDTGGDLRCSQPEAATAADGDDADSFAMPARAVDVLWDVEVGDQRDAEPLVEGDLAVIDAFALGERLVPRERALRKCRRVDRHHAVHCDTNARQLQDIAAADIDATLMFDKPPCFALFAQV